MEKQSMEIHGGADPGESQAGADGCPKEDVTPWEAHTGADSQQDFFT